MKTSEAIEILEAHNKWRRGDDNYKMAEPAVLGKAIEHAIEHMRRFQWLDIASKEADGKYVLVLMPNGKVTYAALYAGKNQGWWGYDGTRLHDVPVKYMISPEGEV